MPKNGMELITAEWTAYQLTWQGIWADRFGNLPEAEDWYLAAVATGSSDGYQEYSLGWIAERGNQPQDAANWYRKGIEAGHYNSVVALAQLEKDQRDWDEAIKWFLTAIAMGKSDGCEEGWLGWLLNMVDQPDGARYWYLKAAELGDKSSFAGLGYLARDAGDLTIAKKWFLEAVSKGVSDGSEEFALALIADKVFQPDAVIKWLLDSARLGNFDAVLELAVRASMVGNSKEAEFWQRTLLLATAGTGVDSPNGVGKLPNEEIITQRAQSWRPSQNPGPQPPDYRYLIRLLEEVIGPVTVTVADCGMMGAACPGCRNTCRAATGICAKHYGGDPTTGDAVKVGATVGADAVQAISDAVAQLLELYGTGTGTGNGEALPRIVEILEVCTPPNEAILAECAGSIAIVHDGERSAIVLNPEKADAETITYRLNPGTNLAAGIEDGAQVNAGTQLSEGQVDAKKVLRILGLGHTARFLVNELQSVFKSHGVAIADQHLELAARQMLQWVKVIDNRESRMPRGAIVSLQTFRKEGRNATVSGLRAATGRPVILGITRLAIELFANS